MAWAEPFAFGPLNLKPWEFERLQPHEFYSMFDGYNWRKERSEETIAYFVSGLMNLSGKSLKRNITPMELVNPLRQHKNHQTKSEEVQYLEEVFNLNGGE